MPTVAIIAEFLKKFAPLSLAEDWDNVGLLLGDEATQVRRAMTCMTITPESAAEAIEQGAELIVSHHPILFRPVQKLTTATPDSRFLWQLARAGVAVYSPHTAFDNTRGGINDMLARRLGLLEVAALRPRDGEAEFKIVVFVPEADLERVLEAGFAAGAGMIGEYTECSFRLPGTGTFFGSDAANPTVGEKGRREAVSEYRVEMICPKRQLSQAIAAIVAAHSYEEPAYDIYPLQPKPSGGSGRIGRLPAALPLAEFALHVKTQLNASLVQLVGEPQRPVQRVALACGAAGEFLKDAVRAKADVFVTGEMRFHDYLAAQAKEMALVLAGHYATERPAVEELAQLLQQQWPELTVWASQHERDPVQWLV
jgi:dinuclear metal center YbgI/SA1388 family protein